MPNAVCDVGDHFGELRLSIVAADAVGENAHRRIVFADAVDSSCEVVFGAERGLQEAVDDLTVGEGFFSAR